MSVGVENRPSGMLARNLARFSGVSGMPMKVSKRPVSPITGLMAQTRIRSGASSTAIDRVSAMAAPLEPLYQVSPGRGRTAAVDAMLMMTPPRARRNTGTACSAER
jgi:hypothetical protein